MTTTRPTIRAAFTCLTAAAIVLSSASVASAASSPTALQLHPAGGDITPKTPIKASLRAKSIEKAEDLPASVDLTPWAISPGDQGQVGSCVSWAIGHNILGWYSNRVGDPQTFAPMYLYSQTHSDNSSDGGGSSSWDAYDVTENQGIDTAAHYVQGDYNFTTTPTSDETANAAQYKTTTFHKLYNSGSEQQGVGESAENAIKGALATGNPVGLSIPIYTKFDNLDSDDSTLDLNDPGANSGYRGTHYVAVFGYDDQGITIENSWGTEWGNKGFAKIDWNFINAKSSHAEYLEGMLKYMGPQSQRGPSKFPVKTTDISASEIDIDWDRPTDPGTTALSGYTVTVTGGGTTKTYSLTKDSSYKYITGLKSYTNYTINVTASNTLGLSTTSTIKVQTKAKAPTLKGIHGKIYSTYTKWYWKAATAGSGNITKYTIVVKYKGKITQKHSYSSKTRTATIKNLKRKHLYHFLISAYNSAGQHTTQNWTGKSR